MTSIFANSVTAALGTLQSAAGRAVVYRRGEVEINLTAVPGESRFDQSDIDGLVTQAQTRDYLVAEADLGTLAPPAAGDRIIEVDGDLETTYQVMAPGPGASVWRHSDPARSVIRVHTKRVDQQVNS